MKKIMAFLLILGALGFLGAILAVKLFDYNNHILWFSLDGYIIIINLFGGIYLLITPKK